MKMGHRRGRHKGVTIFEIMIAIGLFAIIVVPVMRSFVTSIKVNKRSREIMIATDVAQSIMEGFSGKTYADIWKGMDISKGGFTYTGTDPTGKYAFSSIDKGFFNKGWRNKELDTFTGNITVSDLKGVIPGVANVPLDKLMTKDAVANLRQRCIDASGGGVSTVYAPNEDSYDVDTIEEAVIADDKIMYYGYSADKNKDNTPKFSYIVYNRVQKGNYFYDVTCIFIPRSTDKNVLSTSPADDFFPYEVKVSVYEYKYDDYDPTAEDFDAAVWESRFEQIDGSWYFEGEPVAVMTSGILNK